MYVCMQIGTYMYTCRLSVSQGTCRVCTVFTHTCVCTHYQWDRGLPDSPSLSAMVAGSLTPRRRGAWGLAALL